MRALCPYEQTVPVLEHYLVSKQSVAVREAFSNMQPDKSVANMTQIRRRASSGDKKVSSERQMVQTKAVQSSSCASDASTGANIRHCRRFRDCVREGVHICSTSGFILNAARSVTRATNLAVLNTCSTYRTEFVFLSQTFICA
jgi:hypothetical protein